MKSEIDVIYALSSLLETEFPTIPIKDEDEAEGFDRSCFAISVFDMEDGKVGEMNETNIDMSVFYFCKGLNSGFLELLNMKKALAELLQEPIKVDDDFYFTCDDLSFVISKSDKALSAEFSVHLVQYKEPDTEYYYMKNLVYKKEEV